MKLDKETLRQIIKEELKKVLLSENDLLAPDIYGNQGYKSYLISPRFISQDTDKTSHFTVGEPDYYADRIIQALRGDLNSKEGLDAIFKLFPMITMDEEERHPAFPSDEKTRTEIMDFLDFAIEELQS